MIAEIRLRQFRSYLDRMFQLSPGVNIVVGPNASGKTNLLEAVMVVCKGSSYRAPDGELIMHGKKWATVDAKTDTSTRAVKLTTQDKTNKEFLIGAKTHKRLSVTDQIPIVLFEPNHLLMLSGSPELRRNYLDGILELTQPGYKKTRNDYQRTLSQRNTLLKSGRANPTNLFPWNVRLSQLGGQIAASRTKLSLELNKNISAVYANLAGSRKKIELSYRASVGIDSYESRLLKKLETSFELDLMRGFTANGPHREDLGVLINNKPPSSVASRGEARTITIALKTLEAKIIQQKLNQKPIILFDDVFSELDHNRSRLLAHFLTNHQSVITTSNSESSKYYKQARLINIATIKPDIQKA